MKSLQEGEYGSKSTIDRISELPREILQRILYFLSQKDAVRTSILSKSWRRIWCTRLNLDFSNDTFRGNKLKFISVVNNTLQIYCDQKLSLEEFGLSILLDESDQETVSLLEKWIPILAYMGMKKFCLSIRSKHSPGFIHLPSVVFGAESLQELHVKRFMLDQKDIERIVLFRHLKKLRLEDVYIEDQTFQRIISSCPLIETMSVKGCESLKTIKLNDLPNLKDFYFSDFYIDIFLDEFCDIEIHTPYIQTITIYFGDIWFHEGADFRNLRVLYMCGVCSSLESLSLCKFPSLNQLTLWDCGGLEEEIRLFIDAPNIKYFEYKGDFFPSMSFATTFKKWDSNICPRSNAISYLWFLTLGELLGSLSQSDISLCIDYKHGHMIQDFMVPYDSYDKPVVIYCLRINCGLSNIQSLLNGLFCICRPKYIGDFVYSTKIKVIEYLWTILMRRETGNQYGFRHEFWSKDLAQVRIEIKKRNRGEWRAITWSETPNYKQGKRILTRFALKWKKN